jgi:hypothetical protein
MKKLFTVIFLFACLTINATNYYIATSANGGDNAKTGLIEQPWLTLKYACDHTTSGDIINVGVGSFIENTTGTLPVGVSIIGAGITSVITSTNNTAYWNILTLSSAEGANGNQNISNLKFDGNTRTCASAIVIQGRSNVTIHDCTFVDFNELGVYWSGRNDTGITPPSVFATGNSFYSNTVTNCAGWIGYGRGAIMVGGQEGMLIHDNVMDQSGRTAGTNGFLIKFTNYGHNKGLKIYNNTITRDPTASLSEDIAIEVWNTLGGLEIYNNTVRGGNIDIAGSATIKGDYAFGAKIYNNIIGPATYTSGFEEYGVAFEMDAEDIYIYKNHFRNLSCPIAESVFDASVRTVQNIYIYQNIIEECNNSTNYNIWGIRFGGNANTTFHNINIWNNVIIANATMYAAGHTGAGIFISQGIIDHLYIRNNIIKNFLQCLYEDGRNGSSIDYLYIENNVLYSNGNSNDPYFANSLTPTHYTIQNNIKSSPLFTSTTDFHLVTSSPAKDAGIDVGLTTDYSGQKIPFNIIPDIGVYEYRLRLLRMDTKITRIGSKAIRQ